jgi:hypothetical protein
VLLWTPTPQTSGGRLPELLQVYEARDIYNADEMGLLLKCLPGQMLTLRPATEEKVRRSDSMVLLCTNSNGSDKWVTIIIGMSVKLQCFKNVKKLL